LQTFDFLFKDPIDYTDLMESWFPKCTQVLVHINKIEDEDCRSYIFEYFFKFLSYRFSREDKNKSLIQWIIKSKFDRFVYLLFCKQKYLNQTLFDHMSEALCNLFLVPEILDKFDIFLLLTNYETLLADLLKAKPQSVIYIVGIMYSVLQKMGYNLEVVADAQANYKQPLTFEEILDFHKDNKHNRMFFPSNNPAKQPDKNAKPAETGNKSLTQSIVPTDSLFKEKENSQGLGNASPTLTKDVLRTSRIRDQALSVNATEGENNTLVAVSNAATQIALSDFQFLQTRFYEKLSHQPNSVVKFTVRVLQYCLKRINYKHLVGNFDFKNKVKEREYFRYMHLIVDLAAKKSNHFVLMSPMFVRDVISFILNTESESLFHYSKIFDCKLKVNPSPHQHDQEELFP
jgi:hypothetical protein